MIDLVETLTLGGFVGLWEVLDDAHRQPIDFLIVDVDRGFGTHVANVARGTRAYRAASANEYAGRFLKSFAARPAFPNCLAAGETVGRRHDTCRESGGRFPHPP